MKTPETPPTEVMRLNTLRALKVLDSPPEQRFDRLTRLAKWMFDVPIAVLSLVDENRQWFKSVQGLEVLIQFLPLLVMNPFKFGPKINRLPVMAQGF